MSNKVTKKQADLVDRLYSKTMASSLVWQLDTDRKPTVSVGRYTVTLDSYEDGGNPLETLSVNDEYGEFVESFSDEDLAAQGRPDTSNYWSIMKNLRQTAFRQAVGADKAIDDILNSLDDNTKW